MLELLLEGAPGKNRFAETYKRVEGRFVKLGASAKKTGPSRDQK